MRRLEVLGIGRIREPRPRVLHAGSCVVFWDDQPSCRARVHVALLVGHQDPHVVRVPAIREDRIPDRGSPAGAGRPCRVRQRTRGRRLDLPRLDPTPSESVDVKPIGMVVESPRSPSTSSGNASITTCGLTMSWRMSGSLLGAKSTHPLPHGAGPVPDAGPVPPIQIAGLALRDRHLHERPRRPRDRERTDEGVPAVAEGSLETVVVEDERAAFVRGVAVLVDPDEEEGIVPEALRCPGSEGLELVDDTGCRVTHRHRLEIQLARRIVPVGLREVVSCGRAGRQQPGKEEERERCEERPPRCAVEQLMSGHRVLQSGGGRTLSRCCATAQGCVRSAVDGQKSTTHQGAGEEANIASARSSEPGVRSST